MDRTGALLRRLGDGDPIPSICATEGWEQADFDRWWAAACQERLARLDGTLPAAVPSGTRIVRDGRGVPHVLGATDRDVFVGYGFAIGQDRLFQLELQRRTGHGTLAALMGPDEIEVDRIAHTIGYPALVARETAALDEETRALHAAYADGINLAIGAFGELLPVEFGLLGVSPEPWEVADTIACVTAWRWQFTGRPHAVAGPELLRRALGDETLFRAVLAATRECDEAILPPDAVWPPAPADAPWRAVAAGPSSIAGDVTGSNDWVITGSRSRSGKPLLGADPHMPYQSSSAFYEVGLHGGSFDAVGAAMVGVPGLLFGRDRHVTWGITNNICSLRDIYQERITGHTPEGAPILETPDGPRAATQRRVAISVRGAEDVVIDVTEGHNGPLIDALLPPLARDTGPVSMRWLGTQPCDLPAALLRLTRATSIADANHAVDGWLVPTFSLMLGDTAGGIGFRATGRIPIRAIPDRGYRPGWDAAHQWLGLIPESAMPQATDPARGWLASANNRPAPDSYPYPLSGTWDEGYRARWAGELIEAAGASAMDIDDLRRMHTDVRSNRAAAVLDDVLALFAPVADEESRPLLDLLRGWDRAARADSAGALVFEVLSTRWAQAVMAERVLDQALADYLANWGMGLAVQLLTEDTLGWFNGDRRSEVAAATLRDVLEELRSELGHDMAAWRWGAVHRLSLRHPLGHTGDLGQLLDKPTIEVDGDLATLSNSGFDGQRPHPEAATGHGFAPSSGAGYRLQVDLGEFPVRVWTITLESQSAQPGSPHYDDQRLDFVAGRTRALPLDLPDIEAAARHTIELVPIGETRP